MIKLQQKWLYLIFLALVWGSSFILMKKALIGLTPLQVGALRSLIGAIFIVIIGYKSLKEIQKKHWKYVFVSAMTGTFFPAFLYAFAISGIDSSIASILNSLTPFNTLVIGLMFFNTMFSKRQFIGVLVGLAGTSVLILQGANLNPDQNYWYALLPILASIGYACNVNIIKKHLQDLKPLAITTGNFIIILVPMFIVLFYTGFFTSLQFNTITYQSLSYVAILAIIGTAVAKVVFNKLIHISSPVFSTSVTYLIPIVAVLWGVLDGEQLSIIQLLAGIVILFGVYLVNRKK